MCYERFSSWKFRTDEPIYGLGGINVQMAIMIKHESAATRWQDQFFLQEVLQGVTILEFQGLHGLYLCISCWYCGFWENAKRYY